MRRTLYLLATLCAAPAAAADFAVNPDAGNNSLAAVFDAALGERITAVSSAVGCEVAIDGRGLASGRCSVPLTSLKVDADDTKTEHLQQWATNKKVDASTCTLEASFREVQLGTLIPEQPVRFTAEVPFQVCGRPRADGGREHLTGTAVLFPPGTYGERMTIRIRATVVGFDRDAYRIGPKYTEGWLARVQSLAKVVAEKGTIDLSLFAKQK